MSWPRNFDKDGMRTPWGAAQQVYDVAPGITLVCTASHGGFKLDRARNAQVPTGARNAGGWYEEDCEWAIVAAVFPEALRRSGTDDTTESVRAEALKTIGVHFPRKLAVLWQGVSR